MNAIIYQIIEKIIKDVNNNLEELMLDSKKYIQPYLKHR